MRQQAAQTGSAGPYASQHLGLSMPLLDSSSTNKITDSPATDVTSPTRSIKNFFKNRLSTYSIDSISEKPELSTPPNPREGRLTKKTVGPILSGETSPNRTSLGGLNQLLRPKFVRSKSSLQSSSNSIPTQKNFAARDSRATTIDDFADTSSSEEGLEDGDRTYDSASFSSSLLLENREAKPKTATSARFVFKETFDESDDSLASNMLLQQREQHSQRQNKALPILQIYQQSSHQPQLRQVPPLHSGDISSHDISVKTDSPQSVQSANILPRVKTVAVNKRVRAGETVTNTLSSPPGSKRASLISSNDSNPSVSGNSSVVSLKKNEPRLATANVAERKKVVSTSSNIDPNRSSLYNLSTHLSESDTEPYPAPDLSNTGTPHRFHTNSMSPGLDSNVENITTRSIDASILPSEHDRQAYRFARSPTDDPNEYNPAAGPLVPRLAGVESGSKSVGAGATSGAAATTVAAIGAGAAVAGTAVAAGNYIRTGGGSQMQIIQDDATMENASRNSTVRSSMSSGELLNKLENSGMSDGSNPSQKSKGSNPFGDEDETKNTYANLTAGVDSTNDLPVMLYKVQDKDYDEGENRWSYYEHNHTGQQPSQQPKGKHVPTISSTSSGSDYKHFQPAGSNNPFAAAQHAVPPSSPPVIVPIPQQAVIHPGSHSDVNSVTLYHTGRTSHSGISMVLRSNSNKEYIEKIFDEHIGDFDKPRGIEQRYGSTASVATQPLIPVTKITIPIPEDSVRRPAPQPENERYDFAQIEKEIEYLGRKRTVTQSPQVENHSWAKFGSLMILGLVVPPIYLLITCGLFDNNRRSSSQYYSGISYYNEKKESSKRYGLVKKFSRAQKIISCLVGLAWFAIVLAMIGLAFGLRG